MTPAQTHPTEETHADHRDAAPSWVDIWAALEVWCLRWLVRWSADPDHAVMDVGEGGEGGFNLPEHPLLAYRAAAPYLSLAERRAFAHRCCWRVAWMRGACGRFDVHLGRTHGGPKVIFAKWRRLFRVFVDYSRSVRGDGVLPRARVRLPEGGCGPPGAVSEGKGPGTSPGTAQSSRYVLSPALCRGRFRLHGSLGSCVLAKEGRYSAASLGPCLRRGERGRKKRGRRGEGVVCLHHLLARFGSPEAGEAKREMGQARRYVRDIRISRHSSRCAGRVCRRAGARAACRGCSAG